MDTTSIVERLTELGISMKQSGDSLVLSPASKLPASLVEEIQAHKRELLAYLEQRRHAEEVAGQVEKEGVCIFWSDVFQEPVSFIRDDSFCALVPDGIVIYRKDEIEILFAGDRPSDSRLRLIHAAKRIAGARVIDFTKGNTSGELCEDDEDTDRQ